MYFREIESNQEAMREHDKNQKLAAASRLAKNREFRQARRRKPKQEV